MNQVSVRSKKLLSTSLMVICIIGLVFIVPKLKAADINPIPLSELIQGDSIRMLGQYSYWHIDQSRLLNHQVIYSDPKKIPWRKSQSNIINLGFSNKYVWFYLPFINDTAIDQSLYFSLGNPLIDRIFLKIYHKGQEIKDIQIGDHLPFSERLIEIPNFTVPIRFPQNATVEVLFAVKTGSSIQLPIALLNFDQISGQEQETGAFTGIFIGIALMIAAYNFLFFIFLREQKYLFFVLFVSSICLAQLAISGQLYPFVFSNSPMISEFLVPGLGTLTILLAIIFFDSLFPQLSTKRIIAESYTWIRVLCYFNFLLIIGAPHPFAVISSLIISLIGLAIGISISTYAHTRGESTGILAVISWVGLLIGNSIFTANKLGLIDRTFLTEHSLKFGVIFQIVTLSFVLTEQYRKQRKMNDEAASLLEKKQKAINQAKEIQEALNIVKVASSQIHCKTYYHSAQETGGDWLGLIEDCETKRLYLFIGDVTGHGLASAVVTAAVSGAIRAGVQQAVRARLDLNEALIHLANRTNRIVCNIGMKTGRNMTMGFVAIDLATKKAAYLNAGHPPLMIIKRTQIKPLIRRGSILGISHKPKFSPFSFELESGDIILGYTDGFLENTGPDGKTINARQLFTRLLDGERSPDHIIKHLVRIGEETWLAQEGDDDLTAMAIQVA